MAIYNNSSEPAKPEWAKNRRSKEQTSQILQTRPWWVENCMLKYRKRIILYRICHSTRVREGINLRRRHQWLSYIRVVKSNFRSTNWQPTLKPGPSSACIRHQRNSFLKFEQKKVMGEFTLAPVCSLCLASVYSEFGPDGQFPSLKE